MHACCKCFRKAGGKVVSGSEDGFNPFGKPLHLSVNSSVFGGILISMVQKRDVILLEKVLCQTGIVNHIVVLLKDPVNTSYTKPTVTSSHTKPGFDTPAEPEGPLFHYHLVAVSIRKGPHLGQASACNFMEITQLSSPASFKD
ncbi:hypothetical protein XENORESO_017327 [Xenotaenia resolanae]|uniref:Uncharacterized protein n=1 Tax=Xenotaenia resolanae TaxID=208358 RepID=A0ABV0WFX1_9TELE